LVCVLRGSLHRSRGTKILPSSTVTVPSKCYVPQPGESIAGLGGNEVFCSDCFDQTWASTDREVPSRISASAPQR
jgi:hypothetical protein